MDQTQKPVSSSSLIEAVDQKITSVRTQSLDFSFNELADMYRENELIISPDFQRMFRWTDGAQARFIESLILELPVPPIFLIEKEDRVYELIDGLQRVSSFLHFRGELRINGELQEPLRLVDCDIVPELNDVTYADLPKALEIKLKRSYIRAEILRKESDPRLRYYMFKRLNTGGEILSEQEIRNATIRLLSNDFNSFISKLSENEDFKFCIDIITETQALRKFDQELVLRFFAYKNNIDVYRHDVADFLTDYMEDVSDPNTPMSIDFVGDRAVFEKTFRILHLVAESLKIDAKIFGSMTASGEARSQFSVYHFEALTLGLQAVLNEVDPSDSEQIARLAAVVKTGKADREFLRHCGGGKNYRVPLLSRIEYFASRFREVVS